MRKGMLISVIVAVLAVMAGVIWAQDDAAQSAWLGIGVVEEGEQLVVARLQAGSPADAAELLIGDVIVSANGTDVATIAELSEIVQAAAPGDTLALQLLRNDETVSVDVTLGSAPAGGRGEHGEDRPAVEADPLTFAENLLIADLEEADSGFTVADVLNNRNPFTLAVGDVVTTLNGQNIAELNFETLREGTQDMETPALTITVLRNGEEVTLTGEGFRGLPGGPRGGHGGPQGQGGFDRGGHPGEQGGFNPNGQQPGNDPNAAPQDAPVGGQV